MSRTTQTITFSLPPDMAKQVEKVMQTEGRTRSELIREALRRYLQEREWRDIFRYGEQKARELGLTPDDVERLVDEYRAEKARRAVRS